MSKGQKLRALVNERLTAAAAEIFELFERTIAEYEQEVLRFKQTNDTQQQLLAAVLEPTLHSHTTGVQIVLESKEEAVPSLEPPHIKEEPELCIKQEPEEFLFPMVSVITEDDEDKSSVLHQRATEENREETNGEDCGAEAGCSSDPLTQLHSDSEEHTDSSSDTDHSEDYSQEQAPSKRSYAMISPTDTEHHQSLMKKAKDTASPAVSDPLSSVQLTDTEHHQNLLEKAKDTASPAVSDPLSSVQLGPQMAPDHDSTPCSEVNEESEDDLSDKEHVRDSESQKEDQDLETDLTSSSSFSKVVLHDLKQWSETRNLVSPDASKCQQPVEQLIPGTSEELHSRYKDKRKDNLNVESSGCNYCFICGKPQKKIARHLKSHKTHAEIAHAFSFPSCSKERKQILEKIRNKGNFLHNQGVLQSGSGQLKVKRQPRGDRVAGKFIHCMYCQGMFIRKELWRHARRCPYKPETKDGDKHTGRTKVLRLAIAQESAFKLPK